MLTVFYERSWWLILLIHVLASPVACLRAILKVFVNRWDSPRLAGGRCCTCYVFMFPFLFLLLLYIFLHCIYTYFFKILILYNTFESPNDYNFIFYITTNFCHMYACILKYKYFSTYIIGFI